MNWGIGDRVGVAVSAGTIATFNSRRPGPVPSLILDFAGTGTLDPRVTFTRSTTAKYYDSSTVALAEQNLFLQSNTFSNAAWVKTGGTIATGVTDPAGGTTASSFTASSLNATLYQTVTLTATPYTESIWIQRVSGIGIINLTLDGVTLSPVTITGSWAKYTYTATPSAGSQTVGIQVVTIGDVINIYGSQIENRSAATATNITTTAIVQNYIPQLMTAAINAPRFDYNPTTRAALGLLIEQSSTNLLTYSQDFSNGAWSKIGLSITNSANIAPDGTQTMQLFVEDTTTGNHWAYQSAGSVGSNTATVYAKAGTRSWLIFRFTVSGTITYAWFNLATGTLGTIQTGLTASITLVGNGVYKCSITGAMSASSPIVVGIATGDTVTSYTGNGYSGIYIWGAQLETLAFPTSYIPTTSAQVTRASDNASIPRASWFNISQGTFYAEVLAGKASSGGYGANNCFIASSNNASSERLGIYFDSGTAGTINTYNGVNSYVATTAIVAANVFHKLASFYEAAGIGIVIDAGTVASTSGTLPVYSTFTNLNIGQSYVGGNSLNGYIKKLTYYPTRLTNAQLQALTT